MYDIPVEVCESTWVYTTNIDTGETTGLIFSSDSASLVLLNSPISRFLISKF